MSEAPTSARVHAVSLMRLLLQHACFSLAEWIIEAVAGADKVQAHLKLDLTRLTEPADGVLVAVLGELLIAAENQGWPGVSTSFYRKLCGDRPCASFAGADASLYEVLTRFVEMRNDGAEGHGLPGNYDSYAELDAISFALECLTAVLPNIAEDGQTLVLQSPRGGTRLRFLRAREGHAVCIRRIRRTSTGRCVVKAQQEKGLGDRHDFNYEAPDLLNTPVGGDAPQYSFQKTADKQWCPLVLIPSRMTDCFTGREEELESLKDWAEDEGSRACLVYGDAGVGKTTLVVEFLHRLLEGEARCNWKPDAVTYYTAKQTRWGLSGLERISLRDVGVSDVALDIVRALEGRPLGKEWFTRDADSMIGRLEQYLAGWGIRREKHLIVLDNTETMAADRQDVDKLSSQIRELTRRVGRVLVTSRRREAIEARPIEVRDWSTDETVLYLKERGQVLGRRQLMQAGDATIRKYADQLGNKPLFADVFLQALEEQDLGLETAFQRVLGMQRRDLGEFLYSDAWRRLSNNLRHLLLLMTGVGDVHDEVLVKLCCLQTNVRFTEAHEALLESRGIASVTSIGDHIQVAFNAEFLRYCADKTVKIEGESRPRPGEVEKVRDLFWRFQKGQAERVRDRVSRAYRHPLARAAWLAFKEERWDDCESFYEMAVAADKDNGWLFDRYAYFLFTRKRFPAALERGKRATELLPDDAEVWFTRGMIEARLGLAVEAQSSLNTAEKSGKPSHLCRLQAAYAAIAAEPPRRETALRLLDEAEKTAPRADPLVHKHLSEVDRLRKRCKYAR